MDGVAGGAGGHGGDPYGAVSAALAAVDLRAVARMRDPGALLPAVADAVAWAMYWQEPDEVDAMLQDAVLAGLLRPLAEAVLASPASGWWTAPLAREDQWQLRRGLDEPDAAPPTPATAITRTNRRESRRRSTTFDGGSSSAGTFRSKAICDL